MEEQATKQWLTIATNEVYKTPYQCHIIVVVSHVNQMIDRVKEGKQNELQQIIEEKCNEFVSIEYLDCHKLGGSSITSIVQ